MCVPAGWEIFLDDRGGQAQRDAEIGLVWPEVKAW